MVTFIIRGIMRMILNREGTCPGPAEGWQFDSWDIAGFVFSLFQIRQKDPWAINI